MTDAARAGPRGSAFSGARWNATGRGAQRAIRFVVSLVLARLLAPADFGLMAVATTVMNFLDLVRDLGTGQAIIQKKEVTQRLLSSLFVMNLASGIGATALLVLAAPYIAWLFATPDVTGVLRVMGVGFGVYSWSVTQRAILLRRLDFRRVAISDGVGAVTNGVVSISLAFAGFGVWALAIGYVVSSCAGTIALWLLAQWRPSFAFSREDLREVRSFSLNLVAHNLVQNLFKSADTFLIGRFLGAAELGIYATGKRLVVFPVQTLSQILTGVLVPALARVQDDTNRMQRDYLRACAGLALVGFPVAVGIGVTAGPLVDALLGPRWRGVVPVVTLLAPAVLLLSTTENTGAIFRALGRTDLQLRWGFAVGVVTLGGYIAGLPYGLDGVAAGYAVAIALLVVPEHWISLRMIDLTWADLARALRPYAIASALLAGAALGARFGLEALGLPNFWVLLGTAGVGAGTYLAVLWMLDPPALADLERMVAGRSLRRRVPAKP